MTDLPGRGLTAQRTLGWTLTGIAVFVASPFVVIPLTTQAAQAIGLPHVSGLAAWSFAWAALSAAGIYAATAAFFGPPARVSRAAWASLAVGVVLSAATTGALYHRAMASFGIYDPDFTPRTSLLWMALLAVALAGFGVAIAPRQARMPAAVIVVAFALLSLVIGSMEVGGALDGIRPESWPLAVAMSLSMLYVVVASALAVRAVTDSRGPIHDR